MTDETDPQLKVADKVAKMLRLAENAGTPEEAETFTAKAKELMVSYAITEALLAVARGEQLQDTITQDTTSYTGIFHMALWDIGKVVALANNLRHMIYRHPKTRTDLIVVGFTKDISNFKVLDASIQVQATTAMTRWWAQQDPYGLTPMQKALERRQFYFSYAHGLKSRLAEADRAGTAAAVEEEAERTGDRELAQKSTDLVLLGKKERVDAWMDEKYGSTLRTVRRNYSGGSYGASGAGFNAGRNADLGNPRVGGKKAIGS